MNIKALITTLILGSASAAMAKPVLTVSGSATVSLGSTVQVRDYRAPAAPVRRPIVYQPVRPSEQWYSPTNSRVSANASIYTGTFGHGRAIQRSRYVARPNFWFNLTEATRIDGGRQFFNLTQQGGSFSKIKLQNLGGRTEITQVLIEYKTRRGNVAQKVVLNSALDRHSSALTIDLSGDSRQIQRIVVYGASGRGSAYQILAM